MSNNNEICIGCPINNDDIGILSCGLITTKDNKQCPCTICLVKTMCNAACEEFKDYLYKYTGKYYE